MCDCILSTLVPLEESNARKLGLQNQGDLFLCESLLGILANEFSLVRTDYMAKIIFTFLPLMYHQPQGSEQGRKCFSIHRSF